MSRPTLWYAPIAKALRAATFFIAHTCLAIVIIALVAVVKFVVHWFGDPELFGWMPLT